jgi:hypothetical protein
MDGMREKVGCMGEEGGRTGSSEDGAGEEDGGNDWGETHFDRFGRVVWGNLMILKLWEVTGTEIWITSMYSWR